jgi:hypothetical protein
MAQTVQYYFDQIKGEALSRATDAANQDMIDMLNNPSKVTVWKVIFYAVAFGIFLIDTLFDLFRIETDEKISKLKPATLKWFAEKIKTFEFGETLVPETDYYDNTGLTESEIEDKMIIKYAAAIEQQFTNGRFGVRIKVAGESGGELVQLDTAQPGGLAAASDFVKRFKPAGTFVEITSDDADFLKLSMRVYYNPLVLNNTGQRLDGTNNTPVQEAINAHLKNLPFNGLFNLTALVDALQLVQGVEDPRILSAQTKYAALPYADVADQIIPDSGYLKIYDQNTDLTIEWVPA